MIKKVKLPLQKISYLMPFPLCTGHKDSPMRGLSSSSWHTGYYFPRPTPVQMLVQELQGKTFYDAHGQQFTVHYWLCYNICSRQGFLLHKLTKERVYNDKKERIEMSLPGLTTSPGFDLISSCLLSRWVSTKWNPQSASVRDRVCSTNRSSPLRLYLGCSFCCRTKTISPVTVSGCR